MHPLQSLPAIEQDIANLERERAALEQQRVTLEAQIEGLKRARDILRPGPVTPAGMVGEETTQAETQLTHSEMVIAFLKSGGNAPQTINAIAKGTGLAPGSVTRVVYRTCPKLLERKKIPGSGMTWRLKVSGGATSPKRVTQLPSGGGRPDRYEAVVAVLREAGRPLTAPEIAAEVDRRGEGHGVHSLRDIVHSVIRRKADSFRKVERNGRVAFTLREREGAGPHLKEEGVETAQEEPQPEAAGPEIPRGLGPSEAILYFLARCPGATRGVIVTALEKRITTSSSDPKHLLFSIIRQLEKNHQIMQSVSGKYYLMPEAEGFSTLKGRDGEEGRREKPVP
jgi:hypothetical protein